MITFDLMRLVSVVLKSDESTSVPRTTRRVALLPVSTTARYASDAFPCARRLSVCLSDPDSNCDGTMDVRPGGRQQQKPD